MTRQTKMQAGQHVDDNWRRWIAENLMLGTAPATLMAVLAGNGIGAAEARSEIAKRAKSCSCRWAGGTTSKRWTSR